MRRLLMTAVVVSATTCPFAGAAGAPEDAPLVAGGASQQTAGKWNTLESIPEGAWLRSSRTGVTFSSEGRTVRLSPNTAFRLTEDANGNTLVHARGGKVFMHLDGQRPTQVRVGAVKVQASQGDFLLQSNGLLRMSGDAHTLSGADLSGELIGLDGPDVRTRPRTQVQGQRTHGTNAGEDLPPKRPVVQTPAPQNPVVASPIASPPPVVTEPPVVAPQPPVAPVNPVAPVSAVTAAGASPIGYIIGGLALAGLGAGSAIYLTNESSNDVFVPTTI